MHANADEAFESTKYVTSRARDIPHTNRLTTRNKRVQNSVSKVFQTAY